MYSYKIFDISVIKCVCMCVCVHVLILYVCALIDLCVMALVLVVVAMCVCVCVCVCACECVGGVCVDTYRYACCVHYNLHIPRCVVAWEVQVSQ